MTLLEDKTDYSFGLKEKEVMRHSGPGGHFITSDLILFQRVELKRSEAEA